MGQIKIGVSELESIQSQISKMSEKANACASSVVSVKNNLDMEISAKKNIEARLDNIYRSMTKHSEMLREYASVLSVVIDEFVRTDNKSGFQSVVTGVNGSAMSLGAILSSFFNTRTDTGDMYRWIGSCMIGGLAPVLSLFCRTSVGKTDISVLSGLLNQSGSKNASESSKASIIDIAFKDKDTDVAKTAKKELDLLKTLHYLIKDGKSIDLGGADKVIDYYVDADKLIKAVKNQDGEDIFELLVKYGVKKPLKGHFTSMEISDGGAGILSELIYSDVLAVADVSKNIANEAVNVLSDPNADFFDYMKVVQHIYGSNNEIIIKGFARTVGGYADIFGGLLDKAGVVDAPEEGYYKFYENAYYEIKDMYNDYGFVKASSIIGNSIYDTTSEQIQDIVRSAQEFADPIMDNAKSLSGDITKGLSDLGNSIKDFFQ